MMWIDSIGGEDELGPAVVVGARVVTELSYSRAARHSAR